MEKKGRECKGNKMRNYRSVNVKKKKMDEEIRRRKN